MTAPNSTAPTQPRRPESAPAATPEAARPLDARTSRTSETARRSTGSGAQPKRGDKARGDAVKIQTLKIAAVRAALEPSEAKLQAALLERLHARGWLAMRVNSGAFKTERGDFFRAYLITGAPDESAGFPDVLAMRARRGCSIELRLFEVKRRGGKPTPEQKRFADFAASRGIGVEIVEGAAGLEALEL